MAGKDRFLMSAQHSTQPTFTLGLDLTTLGAKSPAHRRATAVSGERVVISDVVEYFALAREAGVDLVTIGESFRLDDAPRNDAWLDPAVISSRLAAAGVLDGGPRVVPALPAGLLDPVRLARAVLGIHARSGGRAGWQVPSSPTAGGVHAEVLRVWGAAEDGLVQGRKPLLVTAPAEAEAAVVAGRYSDVVRLRVTSIEEAIARRTAIRTAAAEAGRNPNDVRVLVDAVTVIANDEASALFRADLIRDVGTHAGLEPLTIAGTPSGVADEFEEWFVSGAVDGIVVLPGSLPADVHALATQLAPELRERGLLAPSQVPARPESADRFASVLFS